MRIHRHVYVDIDLGEIGDDDLIAELKERKSKEAEESIKEARRAENELREDLIWIHDSIRDGRIADAMARLERIIWPVCRIAKPKRVA